jgi:hypothetical protein
MVSCTGRAFGVAGTCLSHSRMTVNPSSELSVSRPGEAAIRFTIGPT